MRISARKFTHEASSKLLSFVYCLSSLYLLYTYIYYRTEFEVSLWVKPVASLKNSAKGDGAGSDQGLTKYHLGIRLVKLEKASVNIVCCRTVPITKLQH